MKNFDTKQKIICLLAGIVLLAGIIWYFCFLNTAEELNISGSITDYNEINNIVIDLEEEKEDKEDKENDFIIVHVARCSKRRGNSQNTRKC